MGKRLRTIVAPRLFELKEVIGDRHMIGVAAGPNLDPVILSLEQPPDYRVENPDGPRFPKKRADRANRFRIQHNAGGGWQVVDLSETLENYHHVQPLGKDHWLLVRGRADGDDDLNAHIYDSQGRHVRSFSAGDGIQDVQTTEDGKIWVSYFDEGVFGSTKLGRAGLALLDAQGRYSFEFNSLASDQLPGIADCYALNVASERETWLCYYTDFPLVKLVDGKVEKLWPRFPVGGTSAFAIDEDVALCVGGYDDRNRLHVVRLGEKKTSKFVPVDQDGQRIETCRAFARRNRLFLQTESALYKVDVPASGTGA